MSTFPSVVATLTDPLANQFLNAPSHSSIHTAVNHEVIQIETFIGTSSSAVGTLYYDIRSPNSGGGGHVQTANLGGTGQTGYAKGDLLVASSSSVLTRLAVPSVNGYTVVSDSTQFAGVKWAPGTVFDYQVFTSNGTWNKPTTLSGNEMVTVQMWGGGGGGSGGGGGGGAFVEFKVPASILTASVLVTIGLGGTGGSGAGGAVSGSVGGITTFGSIATAYPGGGGGIVSGGGGGGTFSSGGTGGSNFLNGGVGGNPVPGATSSFAGRDSTSGGGGGAGNGAGGNSINGGGGGGGSGSGAGGSTIYGGAGGGTSNGAGVGIGGFGVVGGNGGNGTSGTGGGVGLPPGGGGGGASTLGGSGARGEVRVWTI